MKKLLCSFILIFLFFASYSEDWTLGIMGFSFKQTQFRGESSTKAATVLPQLIVDQFSSDSIRTIPSSEILDRKLNELQTARLSLFLQLSKEYKSRDALVLKEISPKNLKKSIMEQMEKIRKLEVQIDENLAEVKKAREEAAFEIKREKEIFNKEKKESREQDSSSGKISIPFFTENEKREIISEKVTLYKGDSSLLFTPSDKAQERGFSSWEFEQEVLQAKINGLISGEITCYGDYCSVTASLRGYPGARILGSVTEVGLLSDLLPLANSIARNLDSKIMNALPVLIEFEIEPKEIEKNVSITIDGNVFSLTRINGIFDRRTIEESGIHNISIEAEDYEKLTFTYSFTGDNHFFIHANLAKKIQGVANIHLKKYCDGLFQTYGVQQTEVNKENQWAKLEVNGKNILGVFSLSNDEDDENKSNIAFFRIPANSAFDGANLLVNAKPYDRASNIDKRRRWMYTAYTALICSLPFTFYNLGEFTAENTAYSQGRGDYEHLKELQNRSNICVGITSVLGVWAGIELIRYLFAADKVLPAKAKIDKKNLPDFNPVLSQTYEDEIKQDSESESAEGESKDFKQ